MKCGALLFLIFSSVFANALALREQALGKSCYLLRQKNSLSLCHPANVAREDDRFFYGNFLFSEEINQSQNWKNVIDGKATAAQIISLVEDNRVSYLMSETNVGVVGSSWALTFKPYDLWAKTRIQNPSNPYAQIDAGFAQVLALDLGHYITDELSVGVWVEAAQMKTVKRSFFLTDLIVDEKAVDFQPKEKTNIAISPGVAFEPEDAWSKARYSVFWKQNYVDNHGSLYSGVSFFNDFTIGTLEWGAGTEFQKSKKVLPQGFLYYAMGITTLSTSFSSEEQTFAAFVKLKNFDTGLSYSVYETDRLMLFQMGFSM